MKYLVIGTLCFTIILVIGDAVLPLVVYILTGKAKQSIGHQFPGVDNTTTIGLSLLLIVECIFFNALGALVTIFDLIILVIFLNLSMISKIIVAHIHRLERELEAERVDATEVKRRLIVVMLMHQKYNG